MNLKPKSECRFCGSKKVKASKKSFPAYGQKYITHWVWFYQCEDCKQEWNEKPEDFCYEAYNIAVMQKILKRKERGCEDE